jgi:hypothetical protein
MSEYRDPTEGDTPSEHHDVGDEAQVEKRDRALAVTKANKVRLLQQILGDKIGRALWWEILDLSTWMGPHYGPTQQISDNQAGQREHVFQVLRRCMRMQPHLTAQMIAENDHG